MLKRRVLAFLLSLALVSGLFAGAMPYVSAQDAESVSPRDTETALLSSDQNPDALVRLIVELTDVPAMELKNARLQGAKRFSATSEAGRYRKGLLSKQEKVQQRILDVAPTATFKYGYTNLINGFAVTVRAAEVEAVRAVKGVKEVYLAGGFKTPGEMIETPGESLMRQLAELDATAQMQPQADPSSFSAIHAQEAWDLGYTGGGKVIAIFDAGARTTHEALSTVKSFPNQMTKEKMMAILQANKDTLNMFSSSGWYQHDKKRYNGFSPAMQQSILTGAFYQNKKVPFAVNYADCNTTVWNTGGSDSAHGSHTAGIAAAGWDKDGIQPPVKGVATDAQVLVYRVFSTTDEWGYDEDIMAALDDAATIGADAYNLSIGDTSGFSSYEGDIRLFGYERAFARAKAAGVNIAISSGNSGNIRGGGAATGGSYAKFPDSATTGTPGTDVNVLSVASTQNKIRYTAVGNGLLVDGSSEMVCYLDNNTPAIAGRAAFNNVPIGIVNCKSGDVADIPNEVSGKIALMSRAASNAGLLAQQQNAYEKGAVACLIYNTAGGNAPAVISGTTQLLNPAAMPAAPLNNADGLRLLALLAENTDLKVCFKNGQKMPYSTTSVTNAGQVVTGSSWGPTPDLQLKPEIAAPGGNIYSLGNTGDTTYADMSGTSMASPHVAGAFPLVQQSLEARFPTITGGARAQLVDQLLMSTAEPIAYNDAALSVNGTRLLQSPRWQGAGAMNLGAAVTQNVVLSNTYNQKSKVELGDNLADTFDITFNINNLGDNDNRFTLWGYLQTDGVVAPTQNAPAMISTTPRPIDAAMKVKSVAGGTLVESPDNVNRYMAATAPAFVTVYARSTATVTIEVKLPDMTPFTKDFVNGLFVEGFVTLHDASRAGEPQNPHLLSLPFMGFYDSWLKAPAIDPYSIYDIVSVTDPNYPYYYENSLRTYNTAENKEVILGRNTFATPNTTPSETNTSGQLRNTANTLRQAGNLKRDYIAFSPNGDGYYDNVYGHITMLRGVRTLTASVINAEGQTVRTVGVKDFARKQDKNANGAYYFTNLFNFGVVWDGKDDEGALLPEGTYTYKLTGISDYQGAVGHPHEWSLPIVLDVTPPVMESSGLSLGGEKTMFSYAVRDNHMIQAYEIFYGAQRIFGPVLVNSSSAEGQLDITTIAAQPGFIAAGLSVKVTDFANNVAMLKKFDLEPKTAELAVGKTFTVIPSLPGTYAWSSENTDVATVADGVITGTGAGATVITAAAGGMEATCAVSVFSMQDMFDLLTQAEGLVENLYRSDTWASFLPTMELARAIRNNPVTPTKQAYLCALDTLKAGMEGLVLKITSLKTDTNSSFALRRGKTMNIGLISAPTPAGQVSFTWSSSNPTVATVNQSGLVLGVKAGMAIIRIVANDGSGLVTQVMVTVQQ